MLVDIWFLLMYNYFTWHHQVTVALVDLAYRASTLPMSFDLFLRSGNNPLCLTLSYNVQGTRKNSWLITTFKENLHDKNHRP